MNPAPIQAACESIIDLVKPHPETLQFAIALIDLALMAQMTDIDWRNDYRNALVWIREVLILKLEVKTND